MPRKSATWETALLPRQGRHAVDFFARKKYGLLIGVQHFRTHQMISRAYAACTLKEQESYQRGGYKEIITLLFGEFLPD